jgi:hypothetical protein
MYLKVWPGWIKHRFVFFEVEFGAKEKSWGTKRAQAVDAEKLE